MSVNHARWTRTMVGVGLAALVASAAVTSAHADAPAAATAERTSLVSDLRIEALEGSEFRVSDHAGKVIVLNFWGQWCGPCLEELPHLQRLSEELTDVVFATVNTDGREFSAGMRKAFQDVAVRLPIYLDENGSVNRRFSRASTTPFTVVIGPDGRVAWTHSGFDADTIRQLRAAIAAAKR